MIIYIIQYFVKKIGKDIWIVEIIKIRSGRKDSVTEYSWKKEHSLL